MIRQSPEQAHATGDLSDEEFYLARHLKDILKRYTAELTLYKDDATGEIGHSYNNAIPTGSLEIARVTIPKVLKLKTNSIEYSSKRKARKFVQMFGISTQKAIDIIEWNS